MMNMALATAWRPRGEETRFQKLLPHLMKVYSWISVSFPPEVEPRILEFVGSLPGVTIRVTTHWSEGRHTALAAALDRPLDYLHYADFDRLLRWVETRQDEWLVSLKAIEDKDCLIHGRTMAAYTTHPQALVQTEVLSNRVVSSLLGQQIDVSAGSKGFSRLAVEYILEHSPPRRALGMDAEWPLLLHLAGIKVDYMEVDGLDWESADRYQEVAATQDGQQEAAEAYDGDPANWAARVRVANEIVQSALDVVERNRGLPLDMKTAGS
jgi:hypothetical protein